MTRVFIVLLNCFSLIQILNAAKILGYFFVPSVSHQFVFRPLMLELAKRGHEVTVITTDPGFEKGKAPKNYTEIDLHEKSYRMWQQLFVKRVNGKTSNRDNLKSAMFGIVDVVDEQLNSEEVQNLIKSKKKFDLIILEASTTTGLIISHVFKAPIIQFSTFGPFYPSSVIHGCVSHPLIFGELMRRKLFNLTMWEKFEALFTDFDLRKLSTDVLDKQQAMFRKNFGPNAPTVDDLVKLPEMLFLNVNPIFEGNRPVPPGVIHLGGLHLRPLKPLPEDLQSYLDSSKHGVIYMSFGTNVDTSHLPPYRINFFCRVFSRLPYDVLWKWNSNDLEGKPDNVKIIKWTPQQDLLKHPKIKLFITQGGLQSTDEAIAAAVPLVTIPMLGDQWYNAEHHVRLGIGVKLEFREIHEEVLENAVTEVINNESYRKNIKRLRDLYNDQPQTSLDRAVWWTEYVLRHGGAKHLRSPMANISWTEYLMLDVVITALLILSVTLVLFLTAIRLLISAFLCRTNKLKKS